MTISHMDKAAKIFFSSTRFAVAGASSDPRKFGHKIFAWYVAHSVPATPLNPSSASVSVSGTDYATKASVSELERPDETSLSIITPPAVTAKLLTQAKQVGVRAVWLQPGTFDDAVLEQARRDFPGAAVGGAGGGGGEGWCVLVDGEWAMAEAARESGKL